MLTPVKSGSRTRYSFSRIKEPIGMPNLIEVQRNSYDLFLQEGLGEVLSEVSPIRDFAGNFELELGDFSLGAEKYPECECKERDATYAAPLTVLVRLRKRGENNEILEKEKEVFICDFPLMTRNGTFIINGAERIIVSQLVRSPGLYFGRTVDVNGKAVYDAKLIPNRGAWIELEQDTSDIVSIRIDRERKFPVTIFLKAIINGISNEELLELFAGDRRIRATLEKDPSTTRGEALLEIYKRMKPGEPLVEENAEALLKQLFFDEKRYDLAKVGRYKINKKLNWKRRLLGRILAAPLVNEATGEIVLSEGTLLDEKAFAVVHKSGMLKDRKFLSCFVVAPDGHKTKVFSTVSDGDVGGKMLTQEDLIAAVNYLLALNEDVGNVDDIDHLGNRRLRSVGELLQNQFRVGLARMERVVRERMTTIQDQESATPEALINTRPVAATIKEFFGSSQLSQFMDQTNPLSELTHKRRLSALGPGGLSRERAGFEVRDVHHSHYGRMCPIETPEGPNIGLIGSLSTYAKINRYGFIETPYRRIDKKSKKVTGAVDYLSADEEEEMIVAQANEPLDENNWFVNERVTARHGHDILHVAAERVDYMDVSPKQVVSIATAMIPFLENDDANRALMGANMQRQAVPLLRTQAPLVGTGIESKVAFDSGVLVTAEKHGEIESVTAHEIVVKADDGTRQKYRLNKFVRSNQGTCINQKPIAFKGDRVAPNAILADGPATDRGELALGFNILVAFMPWEGYNYEDAILLSEKLVKEDVFTSIHIEEYDCEARDTKLGAEEITRDIPNVSEDALKDLDETGIIRVGADVRPGDILVGKVTPKGETELSAEEKLLRAIYGKNVRDVRNTSLEVPHGEAGKVVDVKVFRAEKGDDLSPGVKMMVRVYIAQKRKISEGDKMAGRHGNKGVVSRIMAEEDMPFLPDGTPVQIVLNPLGVPSRMNIGQILETHLGWAAATMGFKVSQHDPALREMFDKIDLRAADMMETDKIGIALATPVFDGATEKEVFGCLRAAGLPPVGKTPLYDGRTGEAFDNTVTVGYMYMLKLAHLVDDKIHARSTGPYSLVTQQPLGGKAQFGGQRFGEMEVWALEAYGAAYTLQELLTVKSDDVIGRVKTYEAIVKGENVPEPGAPEAFKVLVKELQSIGLDVKVLNEDGHELSLKDNDDYDNAREAYRQPKPVAVVVEEDVDDEEIVVDEIQSAEDIAELMDGNVVLEDEATVVVEEE